MPLLMLQAKAWLSSVRECSIPPIPVEKDFRYATAHSCSHAGIVNVIQHAVDLFSRPIYMVRSSSSMP